jgi:hypothetical protein
MMIRMDPQLLGVGGVVVALLVLVVLWKLFKLALKVALFIAVCVALAAGVGAYLKYGRLSLPVPTTTTTPHGR